MLETLVGQKENKTGPGRGQLTRPQVEAYTGIRHQQVSKWRGRLKKPDEYRGVLYGAAYREAMGEVDLRGATGTAFDGLGIAAQGCPSQVGRNAMGG